MRPIYPVATESITAPPYMHLVFVILDVLECNTNDEKIINDWNTKWMREYNNGRNIHMMMFSREVKNPVTEFLKEKEAKRNEKPE